VNDTQSQLEELLNMARQAARAKNHAEVIATCEKALAKAPDDIRFVFMIGTALQRIGKFEKGEPFLKRVIANAPGLAAAHQDLGLGYLSTNQLAKARKSLETAAKLEPNLTSAWRALYDVRAAEGDDAGAADAYRRALNMSQQDPALSKALELFANGHLGVAEGICREYLRQRPFDVNAIRLLGEIGIKLRIFDDAINLLERCLELAPDFHIARANYATALARHQKFPAALKQTERLKRDQPDNISHKVQHASILSMAGKFEQAHSSYEEVLQDIPDNAGILTSYGHSLRYGGKGDESAAAYLRAISADASAGEAYWSLANLKTFRFPDKQIGEMRKQLASLNEPSENKYHLAFALGKASEDSELFDESFDAYATGNSIKRKLSAYDYKDTTARVEAIIKDCGADLMDGCGHPSKEPIFIVGLPRVGSTLIEQILASHSDVESTAELPFMGQIAVELAGRKKRSEETRYPSLLNDLSAERRVELGQQYLDRAASYRNGAPRFIDKLPNNWLHVALIKTILPNATIIDARREAMATGFANFKQLFARGQEFTYSLEDIGHYYFDYIRAMTHWQTIFPNQVLTVQYEEVVNDLEKQVRLLLAHSGLAFEDACLRYYEKDRSVRTASSEQVRKPIYRDALTIWKHYEKHLAPLKKVLEDRESSA